MSIDLLPFSAVAFWNYFIAQLTAIIGWDVIRGMIGFVFAVVAAYLIVDRVVASSVRR